jgi:hypothetical protein
MFQWWLAHAAHSAVHLQNPLFAAELNVPMGVNLMANTSVLGVGIPLIPVTLLFGPQISYVVYLTLALAGSAAAAYYVLSRYAVRSRMAAFVGGAFFGMAPGIIHHANGQPNFASNFLLPFIVLRVFRLRESGRVVRNGLALGLLVTWQVFLNEELLLLTAMGVVFVVLLYAVLQRDEARRGVRSFVTAGAIAVATALVLLAYPIWFQFRGAQHYHGIQEVFGDWGEDVTAFFSFARDTLAGTPTVENTIGATEQNSWFGWPLVVLLLVTVVLMWRRSLAARIVTITGVVFAALAAGPEIRIHGDKTAIPGPWRLLDWFPLLKYMYPSRMVYVTIACVAVLLALACDALPRLAITQSTVRFRTAWCLLVVVALVPIIPKPMPATSRPHVPPFITNESWRTYVDAQHTLVTVPLPNNTLGLKAMLWHAIALQEFNMPRGYFLGPDEEGVGMFGAPTRPTSELFYQVEKSGRVPVITDRMKQDTLADLRFWKAAIIVLDESEPHEEQMWTTVTRLTGITPHPVDGVWVWDVKALVNEARR